jgi:hypothetical protein
MLEQRVPSQQKLLPFSFGDCLAYYRQNPWLFTLLAWFSSFLAQRAALV